LRRNHKRCAATALLSEGDALVADKERDGVLLTLPIGRGRIAYPASAIERRSVFVMVTVNWISRRRRRTRCARTR